MLPAADSCVTDTGAVRQENNRIFQVIEWGNCLRNRKVENVPACCSGHRWLQNSQVSEVLPILVSFQLSTIIVTLSTNIWLMTFCLNAGVRPRYVLLLLQGSLHCARFRHFRPFAHNFRSRTTISSQGRVFPTTYSISSPQTTRFGFLVIISKR